MDPDIDKIKKLLEEGFLVLSITEQYLNEDSQCIVKITVKLKKGNDIQVVESCNSQEFSEYIGHFQKRKDKFDNPEFIFVEERPQINKKITFPKKLPFVKDFHKLKISGRTFSEGILTTDLHSILTKGHKIIFGTFWIDLEKNPDFINVDFKDLLEVYDRQNKPIFAGLVKNYQYTKKNGIIEARDITLIMEYEKITAEFIEMKGIDSLSILVKSQEGFKFEQGKIPFNTSLRDFIVIIPIQNLIINESFKIGDVEFYQNFNDFDDSLIRKSDTGRNNLFWNGNFPRAKVTIKATNFFDAIMEGYDIISRAIDIIALRTDFSFPSIFIGKKQRGIQFSYHKLLSKVKIPTIVYCREIDSRGRTFFDIKSIRENILSINVEPQKFFEEIIDLTHNLISKKELTKEEKNHLQVLRWLRRAIQEGDKKDKFLDLWIAFEFLISGEKTESMFEDNDKKTLCGMIDFTKFNQKQQEAIKSKIQMLNDSPLMEKFTHLIERLKIEFSAEELDTFKKLRNKRTDLVHGKEDVIIEDNELNKMKSILEKLLIGKLNASIKNEDTAKIS